MSDNLLVVTNDLKIRKDEITPLRICFCDTLNTPQGNSHDGRAEIESRGSLRRHSCKTQLRQLKAYQGEPPGAVGGIGDRLLKQLSVVFTPYPGFKAVRKDRFPAGKRSKANSPFF
jgi:hypothetical protein